MLVTTFAAMIALGVMFALTYTHNVPLPLSCAETRAARGPIPALNPREDARMRVHRA